MTHRYRELRIREVRWSRPVWSKFSPGKKKGTAEGASLSLDMQYDVPQGVSLL